MFQHVSLLCCSICVCFQQSCFSIRVPTVVFQHLRFSMFHFCVAASVFASNSRVSATTFSAFVIQHLCFSTYVSLLCCSICFRICVAASVFASNSRVSATTFSTFVIQHLCFSTYVSLLCCSFCFRICVAASVFASNTDCHQ
jgi:hypothetical protein